jgi:hypothetical protein
MRNSLTRARFLQYPSTMARTPRKNTDYVHSRSPQTLAEMLIYLPDAAKRRELEKFRIDFEQTHGSTDLTKRYTSTWPEAQQNWLLKHDIKRWFDGLPPFVKAYLRGKMQLAARDGSLDDMPDNMLRLFVSGQMLLDDEVRGR